MSELETVKDGSLPVLVFDSQAQCAEATGAPKAVLAQCKRGGCTAFRHGRVHFWEWFRWFWEQNPEDSENWVKRDKRASALLKETALEKVKGQTLTKDDVTQVLQSGLAMLHGAYERAIVDDLPKRAAGLDENSIRKIAREIMDGPWAEFEAKVREMTK
jgi:hypothetical protein